MNWKENGLHNFLHLKPVKFLCWLNSAVYISYKAKVTKINVPAAELINDAEFIVNDENYKDSKKMEIELLDRSNSEELNFSELKKHGLKSNLQSSIILISPLYDYINSFFD